jgi:hypothetical protein
MKNKSLKTTCILNTSIRRNNFKRLGAVMSPEDFILTLKQYVRHMLEDSQKPDLFMNPIPNPASSVWYNRTHKVS